MIARRRLRGRLVATAVTGVVALAATLVAGCGLGAGDSPEGTTLTITGGFGAKALKSLESPDVSGEETVMRLLQRNARVTTRYGGGFVQTIDGLAGGRPGGRPSDWFYYVNGIEAEEGATSTTVHGGDRVWWDYHDWSFAARVPAVVGSFPEPFVHGIDGKRLPVRVECTEPDGDACRQVAKQLTDREVPAARGILRGVRSQETLRVLVGSWSQLRGDEAVGQLERGPRASGVYARMSADGRTLTTLDAEGGAVRRLGPGTGLVAATRFLDEQPVWVVTGTDAAGVDAAARAFEEGTLEHRFALAISRDLPVPLPEAER